MTSLLLPMLATQATPFDGEDYLFEVKLHTARPGTVLGRPAAAAATRALSCDRVQGRAGAVLPGRLPRLDQPQPLTLPGLCRLARKAAVRTAHPPVTCRPGYLHESPEFHAGLP
jgi:hypothetical protein